MDNPLTLLTLMWRAHKPSHTIDMKALRNTFWLRKGYAALTFFGTIVTATDEEAQELNGQLTSLKNHEMIHLKQAQSCGDSWVRFYLLYIYYWLRALPQNRYHRHAAYWLNPFELEAYQHMNDLHYLEKCTNGATEWRKYARMKPAERRQRFLSSQSSH